MSSEVGATAEGLPALLTFIGSLTNVIFLMYDTVIAGLESFATLLALEGLFPSVPTLMPKEL